MGIRHSRYLTVRIPPLCVLNVCIYCTSMYVLVCVCIALACLQRDGFNMLFVIGGNGTHAGALAVHKEVGGG